MIKPWETYIKPFRIYGNLYFCGSLYGSTHLIDSEDGLILIDTGYPQTLYLLLENIRALGFDPHHIRHIIHSHGHYDHLGATRALIELYHPTTYLGAGDVDYATGTRDLTYATELGYKYIETFMPDVLLNDGDVLNIGGIEFTFMHTPGHTEGCMSFFFNIDGDRGIQRVGTFGGAGLNSLTTEYLERHGLPYSLREDFMASIEKADKMHVDIHMGNHVDNNKMFDKLKKMETEGGNPFIDPDDFHAFLNRVRVTYQKTFSE